MMGVMVGTVRISLPGLKDKHLILADLPVGEFFGEIALLDGEPRSASATALTKCELLVLERRDFLPFLERSLRSVRDASYPNLPLRRRSAGNQ
jgi:CRP-like cAMP-binding protein